VPIVGRIAAGDTITTTEEAHAYVLVDDPAPQAFAIRVVGDSMDPPYRSGDVVVADRDRPVNRGLAVVLFEQSGARTARLKVLYPENGTVTLLSTNPRYAPLRLTRRAVRGAWEVIAHLSRR